MIRDLDRMSILRIGLALTAAAGITIHSRYKLSETPEPPQQSITRSNRVRIAPPALDRIKREYVEQDNPFYKDPNIAELAREAERYRNGLMIIPTPIIIRRKLTSN